jgi:thymidylate kinase
MKQKDDPTIERIRETRHRISEEHGHDPQRVVEYYLELQKKYKQRLLEDSEETHTEPVKA